jgi:hypothetical protein
MMALGVGVHTIKSDEWEKEPRPRYYTDELHHDGIIMITEKSLYCSTIVRRNDTISYMVGVIFARGVE